MADKKLYIYRWGNDKDPVGRFRQQFKGRVCKIMVRGKRNSRLVEFIDNGDLLNCSANALRKAAV